jgi:CO/xanthine dehydrogenase FAD-binding subunit
MQVLVPPAMQDALGELAAGGGRVLAGGTDLMVAINFGRERPDRVVAVGGLRELREVSIDGTVRCGAGVTYTRMMQELGDSTPVLREAARTVGSPQIRNAGTVGGNLGTCSPAGDTLPVLAALDATVILRSSSGQRRVPFAAYMQGPRRPDLWADELIEAVEWARPRGPQVFMKAGTRNAMVISVAMLALVVDRERRRVGLGIGSVAPTIVRPEAAERFAEDVFADADWARPPQVTPAAAARFGELAVAAIKPIDDVRGTIAYRRHIVGVMAARALTRAAEQDL